MPEKFTSPLFPGYIPPAGHSSSPKQEEQRRIREEQLPFLMFPVPEMEIFDPEKHLTHLCYRPQESHSGPSGACPPLPLFIAARANADKTLIPRPDDCYALWDKYHMLDNIRAHSELVAGLTLALTHQANEKGLNVSPEAMFAAGLLHDLGKTYTIHHGGNHAQLGAAWVMHETRNAEIARCVLYHIHWPWETHFYTLNFFSIMAIEYADKRVRHDGYVLLEERFEDLLLRYGKNDYARKRIAMSHEQGKRIEGALSRFLGVNLHEYTVSSGRLVKRT